MDKAGQNNETITCLFVQFKYSLQDCWTFCVFTDSGMCKCLCIVPKATHAMPWKSLVLCLGLVTEIAGRKQLVSATSVEFSGSGSPVSLDLDLD